MFQLMLKDRICAEFDLKHLYDVLTYLEPITAYEDLPFEMDTESFREWILNRDFAFESAHLLRECILRRTYGNIETYKKFFMYGRLRCHEDKYWVKHSSETITYQDIKDVKMLDGSQW